MSTSDPDPDSNSLPNPVLDTKPPKHNESPQLPPFIPGRLSALLSKQQPIILDGALATYLESLGADISSSLWSASILLTRPDLIYKTHLDYFHAGAHVAITASYQASISGLTQHLKISESAAKDVVKTSVHLAKQARDDYVKSLSPEEREGRRGTLLIAGSVGPYGAFLADGSEYRGDYTLSAEEFKKFHRGRIESLVQAGVDVLACETIPSFSEGRALVELLREEFPETEAWFSFTLLDESYISDGTHLQKVIEVLEGEKNVAAVGVNCIREDMALGAIRKLKKLTTKAIVAYPNSGETWNAEMRGWEGSRNEGERLAERAKEWWDAGAMMIGGCCRTTPDDISIISQTLSSILI